MESGEQPSKQDAGTAGTVLSQVRDSLKAGLAPKKQFDPCGFDYSSPRSTFQAADPRELSAIGFSNGVNQLRFPGNNRYARVI